MATLVPLLPSARCPPAEIRRVLPPCSPPGPAGTGEGSPSIAGMLTQGCAKSRGGRQRGEEKSSGEREGGGMQEEMRTHCQLGSCVCCLEAAANHSLQLK